MALARIEGEGAARARRNQPVIDTTRAGDAFNAGFIDAWLNGAADEACLEAGIRFGSLAVQAPGGAKLLTTND
jgi:sugar/nucleoside kinase (ribokinase family)